MNMKIAISGLGRMGMQVAQKLAEGGHTVIAHNRSKGPVDEAVKFGAQGAYEKKEVVDAFRGEQPLLWLMIPADVVDDELTAWLALLPEQSVIIDGGNSDYRSTRKRAMRAKEKGVLFVDVGTSGGIWGYKNGFSMMVGGDSGASRTLAPIFEVLAKPNGAYKYFGESGAGHYVKMVHNAIEYGMMESLAEGYRLLKEGAYPKLNLAAAGEVWQHGSVVNSWLNQLTQEALKENPELTGIEGVVAENGETRWAIETAQALQIPLPAIEASFAVRIASQKGATNFTTKLLAAMRNKFGGHNLNK